MLTEPGTMVLWVLASLVTVGLTLQQTTNTTIFGEKHTEHLELPIYNGKLFLDLLQKPTGVSTSNH